MPWFYKKHKKHKKRKYIIYTRPTELDKSESVLIGQTCLRGTSDISGFEGKYKVIINI